MAPEQIEIQLIACIVSAACAVPGVFLILRRMAMMSDAVSHAILPGIVVAFFLTKTLHSPWLLIGAAAAGLVFATGAALAAIPAPNASDYLGGRTEVGQDLTAEPAAATNDEPEPSDDRPPIVGADLSKRPMTAIGDSVMLGATGALESAFKVTVDAAVSRQFPQIVERINARKGA